MARVKLKFGLDADNVLFNSSGLAIEKINASRELFPPIRREEITRRPFHLSPALVGHGISQDEVSAELDRAWAVHSAEMPLMDPVIPTVVAMLREEGIETPVITTMGARKPEIRPRMFEALERTGIPYDDVHFVSGSDEKVAFPVFSIVDDEQSLAVALVAAGKFGMVYPAPWNSEWVEAHRADPDANGRILLPKDWNEVGEGALVLAKAFRT